MNHLPRLFIFSLLFLFYGEASAVAPPPAGAAPSATLIGFVGDSLTEGLGVASEEAYPKIIEKKLTANGKSVQVFNASISGSTSASAPDRMKRMVKKQPKIVILALGANDALRGLKPDAMKKNLAAAIEMAKAAKLKVILGGVDVPSVYGANYSKDFVSAYQDLAKKYSVELIPNILKNVFGNASLIQSDGLHPNAKGHEKMADQFIPVLEKLL